MSLRRPLPLALLIAFAAGCAHQPPKLSDTHLQHDRGAPPAEDIPAPVARARALPPPRALPPQETYSVVVNNVPAQELLFALARDAKLNVDVHPDIRGTVTINAIDQTLTQILDRIARQVDMRYTLEGDNLSIVPDAPFLRLYKIDYLNMQRDATSNVSIATQVATPGSIGATGGGGEVGNNSRTELTNVSNNRFWDNLLAALDSLLRETDKLLPAESVLTDPASAGEEARAGGRSLFREAAAVIPHPETGTIAVRATARQHERVQAFLDQLVGNARRQVLIEATVVEVELADNYQQGINWDLLRDRGTRTRIRQIPSGTGTSLPGGAPGTGEIPALGVIDYTRRLGNTDISLTVQLLESFGRTKVLSSPKISVLNNQTALIKVVDNLVYFTLNADFTPGTAGSNATFTVSSTPNTVPVGFLMNVTPQVGDDDEVILNLRPTISRLTGFVEDPGVALTLALARQGGASIPDISSRVPEIQTREMESIIKIRDGETAVLGGLMRDRIENASDGVPGISRLPGIGELFKYRNNRTAKSELVIFLRPTIVRDPSLFGDFRGVAGQLPDSGFFDAADAPIGEAARR